MSFFISNAPLPLVRHKGWQAFPIVHGFTTRFGGVSTGECESLNLGINRRDNPLNVRENYRRLAWACGFSPDNYVFVKATHGTNVFHAREKDRHQGRWWQDMPEGYDCVVTGARHAALVMRVADCVPLLLYDPKTHTAGIAHCGWRGVLEGAAANTVRAMQGQNVRPENLAALIGPHIGPKSFLVHEDVSAPFAHRYPFAVTPAGDGRCSVDLTACLTAQLMGLGVKRENIAASDICTALDARFFSQRRSGLKRGNMVGLIQLL